MILPGLKMPDGSKAAFTARIIAWHSGPTMNGMNSPRSRPSPCSPLSEPRYFFTSAATSVATSRNMRRPSLRLQIEQWPGMQFARPGVGIIDAVHPVLVPHQRIELGDVGGQVADVHRRVLDDLARLGITGHVAHQALSGPPQFPYLVGRPRRAAPATRSRVPQSRMRASSRSNTSATAAWSVVADLDHQDRAGIALHEVAVAALLGTVFGAFEDVAVDQLDGRRTVLAVPSRAGWRCSASSMVWKCAHISAPGGGSGSQFSSNSTPRNKVPSEPAISRQKLNGLPHSGSNTSASISTSSA